MANILKLLTLHSALGVIFLPGSRPGNHTGLILEGPIPVSVALGKDATFNCSAKTDVNGFDWFMNDTKCECDNAPSIVQNCSRSDNIDLNSATTNITVDTSYDYNYTSFKCRAYIDGIQDGMYMIYDEENSSSALLKVQGLLDGPGNMFASANSCDTASLIWNEPYSLPGVDILGCQVNLTGIQFENETFINSSMFESDNGSNSWTKSFEDCQDPCKPINASVAGKNEVGIGRPASTIFYFLGAPEFSVLNHSLHYSTVSPDQLQLQVIIKLQSTDCVGRIPKRGNIAISCSENVTGRVTFSNNDSFVPMWLNNTYTANATEIPQNLLCNYTLSLSSTEDFSNSNTENLTTTSQEVNFSTHAVQNISVQQIQGEQKVNTTCTFLIDSQALGCQVILLGAGGGQQMINIFRDAGSVNARSTDSLITIPAGMCDVEAYDIDSNGNVSEFLAASTTLEIQHVSVSSIALETTRVFASSTTTIASRPTETPSTASAVATVLTVFLVTVLIIFITICIFIALVVVWFFMRYKKRQQTGNQGLPSQSYSELAESHDSEQAHHPESGLKKSHQSASSVEELKEAKVLLQGPQLRHAPPEQMNQANEHPHHDEESSDEEGAVHNASFAKESWTAPLLEEPVQRRKRAVTDAAERHEGLDFLETCSSVLTGRRRAATFPSAIMESAHAEEKEPLVQEDTASQ